MQKEHCTLSLLQAMHTTIPLRDASATVSSSAAFRTHFSSSPGVWQSNINPKKNHISGHTYDATQKLICTAVRSIVPCRTNFDTKSRPNYVTFASHRSQFQNCHCPMSNSEQIDMSTRQVRARKVGLALPLWRLRACNLSSNNKMLTFYLAIQIQQKGMYLASIFYSLPFLFIWWTE